PDHKTIIDDNAHNCLKRISIDEKNCDFRDLHSDSSTLLNPLHAWQSLSADLYRAAARLFWKIEKAYSLGIPKKNLALGESQTEEEHDYARRYTMFWPNGRSTGT